MKLLKHLSIGVVALSSVALLGTTNVEATTAVVNVKSLYLREKASTSSDMVDGLVKGQKLEVLEELDGWYKVKADGEIGYVSADYVDIEENTSTTEQKTEEINTETENQEETQTEEQKVEENQAEENKVEEQKQEEQPKEQEKVATTETKKVEVKEFKSREATIEKDAKAYILPLINSNVLKEVKSGSKVTLLDEVNGWYYFEDEYINGWISKKAFGEEVNNNSETTSNTENIEQENTEETNTETEKQEEETKVEETEISKTEMFVNTSSVYVRKGPGTDYDVIDSLILNDKVYAIAEAEDWYKVEVDGEVGYIAKRLLSDKEQTTTSRSAEERNIESENDREEVSSTTYSSVGEEIADFAQEYLGCKYVYGGSGPSTFDCSGFTMYVYRNFGINLSHSATAQSRVGEYVSKDDLQPGDLVFFKDYETMDGIGHVGIYIGDGNFIHASSGTGYCVKISTLLSGSYNTRYATARRLV